MHNGFPLSSYAWVLCTDYSCWLDSVSFVLLIVSGQNQPITPSLRLIIPSWFPCLHTHYIHHAQWFSFPVPSKQSLSILHLLCSFLVQSKPSLTTSNISFAHTSLNILIQFQRFPVHFQNSLSTSNFNHSMFTFHSPCSLTCMSTSNLRSCASVATWFLYSRSWYCLFSCFCSSFSSRRSCFLHTHTDRAMVKS